MKPKATTTSAGDKETRREYSRPSSLIAVASIIFLSFLSVRTKRILCALLLLALAQNISAAQSKPEEVVFPIGGRELHGFLWKPDGAGPFPAILWNHGSEKLPGSQPVLAKFYTVRRAITFKI
jgi:dipeptidyl aminopeptidase/acylaminoacyl peptidase